MNETFTIERKDYTIHIEFGLSKMWYLSFEFYDHSRTENKNPLNDADPLIFYSRNKAILFAKAVDAVLQGPRSKKNPIEVW